MLCRLAFERTDVSEERIASMIRMKRMGALERTLAGNSIVHSSPILISLMIEAIRSPETLGLTRATCRNIPEGGIFIITAVKNSNVSYH
jgi:hypothetical protein